MDKPQLLTRAGKSNILSKVPIVELAGQSRVLIENHRGVLGYSLEEIRIKVCYGSICVTGCDLRLMQLSREQLVICGRVDAIQLLGR